MTLDDSGAGHLCRLFAWEGLLALGVASVCRPHGFSVGPSPRPCSAHPAAYVSYSHSSLVS